MTARTQGHACWLARRLRPRIARHIVESIGASDARLLAYAVMPTHLHVLIRQGQWPLGRVMQPLLRRVALLVHRDRGTEGHVFERRFSDRPCLTQAHARNGIAYIHLNPVRARIVRSASDYPWTSHRFYASDTEAPGGEGPVDVRAGIQLFSDRDGRSLSDYRAAYLDFLRWRIEFDRFLVNRASGGDAGAEPVPPEAQRTASRGGGFAPDPAGWDELRPPFEEEQRGRRPGARPDLTAIARSVLDGVEEEVTLDQVRSRSKVRAAVRARRRFVRHASDAGHTGHAIACYLGVSDQCVSRVLVSRRNGS